jgi:hypothetical protein
MRAVLALMQIKASCQVIFWTCGPKATRKRSTLMMYDHMYGIGPVHMLVLGLVLIIPFWQLFSKAGYSGWWSLLMVIPLVNLIALYVLAFSDWPALRK